MMDTYSLGNLGCERRRVKLLRWGVGGREELLRQLQTSPGAPRMLLTGLAAF